eukprot:scaffold5818_cov42-Phaeocystis_antarctica.AAC.1
MAWHGTHDARTVATLRSHHCTHTARCPYTTLLFAPGGAALSDGAPSRARKRIGAGVAATQPAGVAHAWWCTHDACMVVHA